MFLVLFSDIEVACYGYDGIDAVKGALMKGLELSTEDMPIKVSMEYGYDGNADAANSKRPLLFTV